MGKTTAERFWAKVQIGKPDDCWEWQASCISTGYGRFKVAGKWVAAHRYVMGALSSPLHVMHRCDNPPCCNPAHLFLGTHADNMADKVSKGRARNGYDPNLPQCVNGHDWNEENTRIRPSDGQRECRACGRDKMRRHREGVKSR